MSEQDDERIRELLRKAMAPVDPTLEHDLWPHMLRRLEQRPMHVSWFDWALVALVATWLLFSPEAIPILLYHL